MPLDSLALIGDNDLTDVRTHAGWSRLDRLALVRATGPQRAKFLHGLLSNDIAGLAPGQSRLAALMNLKGQQVAWMRVLCEKDALVCELPAAVRDTVVETFVHYKVGAPVRFDKPDAVVFGLFGAKAREVLAAAGLADTPDAIETFTTGTLGGATVRVSRGSDMPASGFTIHVDRTDAEAVESLLRDRLGEPLPTTALDTLRVEEGLPWHGIDVTEGNLLHETGALATYHAPSKGCYLGQEVVARLEGRGGNVNKRLRGLRLGAPAHAGDAIEAGDDEVGRLTTTGISGTFGPIALGYVHRSHSEPGARVMVNGREAEVTALPFAG